MDPPLPSYGGPSKKAFPRCVASAQLDGVSARREIRSGSDSRLARVGYFLSFQLPFAHRDEAWSTGTFDTFRHLILNFLTCEQQRRYDAKEFGMRKAGNQEGKPGGISRMFFLPQMGTDETQILPAEYDRCGEGPGSVPSAVERQ
jgi:hypothetical protein